MDIADLVMQSGSRSGVSTCPIWCSDNLRQLTFKDLAMQTQQSQEDCVIAKRRVAFEDGDHAGHQRDAK